MTIFKEISNYHRKLEFCIIKIELFFRRLDINFATFSQFFVFFSLQRQIFRVMIDKSNTNEVKLFCDFFENLTKSIGNWLYKNSLFSLFFFWQLSFFWLTIKLCNYACARISIKTSASRNSSNFGKVFLINGVFSVSISGTKCSYVLEFSEILISISTSAACPN